MPANSITAANAVFMLAITGLFATPQQLQGFATEDIFDVEAIEPAETMMGVDGKLSAGFVFQPTKQGITFQGDSASIDMFETWHRSQRAIRDLYFAQGTVTLPGLGKAYTLTRGVLTGYSPMPDAKKVIQPRKFQITWENVSPAAI